MPTPIPFADDCGIPAWLGRRATPPVLYFPAVWRFLLAALVLPPLLAFIATALWLVWMCF
jgi:hypothetical protein